MAIVSISPETKTCIKCGETKALQDFVADPRRPDHHRSSCKACKKLYDKAYYVTERGAASLAKAAVKAAAKKADAKKQGLPSEVREQQFWTKYRITIQDYDALLAAQVGVCAICHQMPRSKHGLLVDHNHSTGQVRGLLCNPCNTAIGLLQDKAELMESAITYINAPPPVIREKVAWQKRAPVRRIQQTHCKRGHPLPPPSATRQRRCLECYEILMTDPIRQMRIKERGAAHYKVIRADPVRYAANREQANINQRKRRLKERALTQPSLLPESQDL